jgi:hypothetical protein
MRPGSAALLVILLAAPSAAQDVGRARPEPAATKAVPVLPPEFFEFPRTTRGAKDEEPPLTVWIRGNREAVCYRPRFSAEGRPEAARLALPGDGAGSVLLVQLARDPSRGIRYFAYDGGEGWRGEIEVGPSAPGVSAGRGPWRIEAVASEQGGCPDVASASPIGRVDSAGRIGPNAGAVLVRVELRNPARGEVPVWGWCLAEGRGGASLSQATRNPGRGATQEWSLTSYVTEDGRAIALALSMSAVWNDPRDGREYVYFQVGAAGFSPITEKGSGRLVLPAGPATPHPVELAAYSEQEWPGCQSRASRR